MVKSKHRPSAWWWKCRECKAEILRNQKAHGICLCRHCNAVGPASSQMALWGHEWESVAWMALALIYDRIGGCVPLPLSAAFVTSELRSEE